MHYMQLYIQIHETTFECSSEETVTYANLQNKLRICVF